jgi:flagella basal body P-ring formation protein FlgA
MNPRSLSPFFISLALFVGLLTASARVGAQENVPVLHSITQDQLLADVSDQLKSHYDWDGDLQLHLLRAVTLPAPSSAPIEVQVSDFPNTISSTLLVRVRFTAAGALLSEVSLSVKAQLWRDAWVTRQPGNRGDPVDRTSLDVRRVDVLRDRDSLPASVELADLSYARSVPADRVLMWRDVAKRVLVRKGEIVEVSASDGQLTITMKALAMQSGGAGDLVVVRNLESRKDISGQVVAENRVRVRF